MPEVSEAAVWEVVLDPDKLARKMLPGMQAQEGTASDARSQLVALVSWSTMQQVTSIDRHHSKTSALSILLECFFNTIFTWPA